MSQQQNFSRAPGSQFQPTPPRSGLSSPSSFFPSSLDPFSNAANESGSSSPVDFRTTFSGGAHSPALSPGTGGSVGGGGQSHNPSFGILENARPYPLVERRSFRDASSSGDVVVSREELMANGNNLGSAGAGAIGEQRRQGSVGPGAIGEARRAVTPSQSQEEAALNLPPGTLDSLAASTNDSEGGSGGGGRQVKSRPSSFILDVLPQSRERGFAGGAGSITPSLSLDSVSQPPSTSSTSDVPFLHSPNNLAPVPHHASAFFQNPNSASSTTSLVSNGGGLNVYSNSRSSSPGPLDLTNASNASSSYDSLANKVNNLESTVSDLSTLLATEFKGLREEVGFLRSLVYQQQQPHRPSFDHRPSHDRETDSPLLTLRSPSPHHSSAFPQPIPLSRGPSYHGGSNHSNSTLLASTSPNPPPLSPHSAPMNFFQPPPATAQERFRNNSIDEKKDEQIKLLTQQVNSLTSTVSNLLSSNSNGLHGGGGGSGGGPMSVGMTSRQMSLPVSGSAGSNEVVSGWKRDLLNGNVNGLGVSTPGGGLMGGKRSISQGGAGGLGRSASLRSASSSQLPGGSSSIGGLRMEQGVRSDFRYRREPRLIAALRLSSRSIRFRALLHGKEEFLHLCWAQVLLVPSTVPCWEVEVNQDPQRILQVLLGANGNCSESETTCSELSLNTGE